MMVRMVQVPGRNTTAETCRLQQPKLLPPSRLPMLRKGSVAWRRGVARPLQPAVDTPATNERHAGRPQLPPRRVSSTIHTHTTHTFRRDNGKRGKKQCSS